MVLEKWRKKVVQHQARKYGETKFGMERFINGFLDLITIWFLSFWKDRCIYCTMGSLMFIMDLYTCRLYWYFKTIPHV
jgi:hypothetical protein